LIIGRYNINGADKEITIKKNAFTYASSTDGISFIPIFTDKACQVKIYWNRPSFSFKVYRRLQKLAETLSLTFINGTKVLTITLTSSGRWQVVIETGHKTI
jgi:hypothetical protein